jgi:outer membrane scaffolding protein for murein synthesis (MipA/OmpV family)
MTGATVARLLARLGACLIVAACLAAVPAAAQTPSPLANWQYSVGEVLVKLGGPLPDWRVTTGIGAEMEPIYEGSKRYTATPSAVIDVRYKDIAFLSDGEGLGVNLLRGQTYRAGVAIDYDLGRDHHLQHRLTGTGNVGVAPEAKLFAEYFLLPFVYRVDIRRGLGGHDGFIGDVGMYVPLPVAKDTYVFTGPSVTFADDRYMQAYFGISPAQASRSQFSAFNAHAGLDRAGWGVTGVYMYSKHLWFQAQGAWEYMLGDAGRSPIVEEKSQFSLGVNVLYHF